MTEYAALIITVLFILYIFGKDIKRKSGISHALWIPFIWMIYSASKPISFFIYQTPQSAKELAYMEGNPIDRTILSILILLSLYVLYKREIEWPLIFKRNISIFLWLLYCGVSIFWSDFQIVSLKRWIKEIGLFLSVLIVLTEVEPVDAVTTLFKRFAYIMIPFSILFIVYFPKIGISYSPDTEALTYVGVAESKNGLGRICLVAGFFFLFNLVRIRNVAKLENLKKEIFFHVLFLIMILWLLIISNSVTSLITLVIGSIVFIGLGGGVIKKNIKYIGIFIIVGIIFVFLLQMSFDFIGMFIKFQGRDWTFTGRTRLWEDLLAFRTNPWIGVGYGSFWLGKRLATLWGIYAWLPNESHNGYLNVYLELGVIGIFLLAGVIYCVYQNIKNALKNDFYFGRFRMGMFIIALLYNITEDAIGKMTLIWFVFLLISIDIPKNTIFEYPRNYYNLLCSSKIVE